MAIIERSDIIEATPNLVNEIIQGVVQSSKILPLMTRLPNMSKSKEKIPVMSLLPEAYWVSGDNGLKGTTKMAWENKFIYAEELAVVVPIPQAVIDDSDYDIIGEAKPRIIEAIQKKIDEAIISGKNKPALFREGLIPTILNVGNNIQYDAGTTLYEEISAAMGKVETDGYDVNALIGGVGLKQTFRDGFRDTTGQPLQASEVLALQREFINNGAWDDTVKFVVGDFKQAVYSIRRDIEFKLFDAGVVTDSSGNIIYNLMQQDMLALRVTMRLGWQVPNAVNALNPDEATRFPFALVEKSSAPTTYNVTFTVTDTSSAAVSGAKVEFAGEVKKTNSSGQAVFKSLGNSTYNYEVTKAGANPVKGTTVVETSNVTVNIANF